MHLYTILCGIYHLSAVAQSSSVIQDIGVTSTTVGNSVTLHCSCRSEVAMHFSWYRQRLGRAPELVSNIYKYDISYQEFYQLKAHPRYSVQMKPGLNHLHISHVQCSDSAMYFCGIAHSNMVEFGDGVFLRVQGNDSLEVVQQPVSESVQPGDSVMFNCTVLSGTCDGQRSVYWLRGSSRITDDCEDQCKRVSTPAPPTQSSIYYFQKTNVSLTDAGTYYCAVTSCGEILFGSGSKLNVRDDSETVTAQMRVLVHLSIIRIGVLLSVLTICLLVYICKRSRARGTSSLR